MIVHNCIIRRLRPKKMHLTMMYHIRPSVHQLECDPNWNIKRSNSSRSTMKWQKQNQRVSIGQSDSRNKCFVVVVSLLKQTERHFLSTGWPFGSLVCKMSGMVQGISVSASVFTLVAIAVDRFRCIVYPFKQKLTISTATLIIVVIWVLAISIMCPSGVMLQVTKEQSVRVLLGYDNKTSPFYWCRENWPNQEMRKIYTTVLFANIYLAPLSLIVIMYARIGITLFKTKKQRVIKMLLIVALLFILSWLPLWTLMMLSDYASLTEQQYRIINIYVYPFAHWLAFFNSSVNPIIYGFFNENFRRGFQAMFKFSLCAADGQRRKSYSHRLQGNSVLPANNVQTSMEPISLNSLGRNDSRPVNHVPERELVMEDLEKGSCSSGGVTAVSI
uniref:Neuropeptide FF receptor 2 n=1 Tax=Fundulus heteroclitus TaxID=8078 RepID=A0A3Q2TCU8_FUNHE